MTEGTGFELTQERTDPFEVLVDQEQEFFNWQRVKIHALESVLAELVPANALADVGCFTGLATMKYAVGFEKVVGFDASERALQSATEKGLECRLWRGGDEQCPASDGEFDVIVAADVIEHVVDTDSFLGELRRILVDDGFLIVTTPNLAFWLSRIRLLLGKQPWSSPGPSPTVRRDLVVDVNHIRVCVRSEWEMLFETCGFSVLEVRGWSILESIGPSMGVVARRFVDRLLGRRPEFAYGLLFVLRKARGR